MLVFKARHGLSFAALGVLIVLQLSSCGTKTPASDGSSGMSSSASTAGKATAGSAGSPLSAGGSGGSSAIAAGSGPYYAGGPASAFGGDVGIGGGLSSGPSGGTGGAAAPCTDIQNPDHAGEPCSIWPDYDAAKGTTENCDASWLTGMGYCLASCGKCTLPGSGGNAGQGAAGYSTGLGPGPTLPDVNASNKVYWASRYWDCCKPHCATNGNTPSCGADGVSRDSGNSACSGGSAYACYNEAPRAIGDNVSYGYVAVPNPSCGTCYHLQFTGTGHSAMNDPGSKTLAGKHMIVKITNTGGDVAGNQFDLMIPGGGVGQNANTCPNEWKLKASDLGPAQGGFLTGCTGTFTAKRECVRQKCMLLPDGDARKGCLWFVDWYQTADNPNFRYESIQCPSDI